MSLLDRLGNLARLAGIVGLAAGSLVLSYCSHSSSPTDTRPQDLAASPDARVDLAPPDARVETSRDSGVVDGTAPRPDRRLWDVLCE